MNKWLVVLYLMAFTLTVLADEDYRAVYAKIQSKITQIHSLESQIVHLIEAKNHAPSSEQKKLYVDEMIRTHDQLKTIYEDYSKELTRLRYQYPDQGETFQRKYPRLQLHSLDEMEVKFGLNGDLDRILSKMRQIYTTPNRGPASARREPRYEWYEPPALVK